MGFGWVFKSFDDNNYNETITLPWAGTLPKGLFCKDVYRNNKFQNSKQKFWNNIQIIISFESLELHQRFKMRLCYVTERLFRISKGVMYMARRSIPLSHSERVWWRSPPWRGAWWCDLRQLWVDVMLCHYLFRGFWFAVLLFLIKSTRDYLKAKNVATTVIYAILDNGLQGYVARHSCKGVWFNWQGHEKDSCKNWG